jgi:nucleoside-diphosphate kinase
MVEESLVFIKPDGVKRGLVGRVLQRFEDRGLEIKQLKLFSPSAEQVDKHYEEHVEKAFYPELKSYIMSGPIAAFVVSGEGAIAIIRKMIGVTNAAEALPGTIRGDFALTMGENIIHASDSQQSADREINNFFA